MLAYPKHNYTADRAKRKREKKQNRTAFWTEVMRLDKSRCQHHLLMHDRTSGVEAHHIIYRSPGGSDEVTNGIALCPECRDKAHNGCKVLGLTGRQFMIRILESHRESETFRWGEVLRELKTKEAI